jgi:P-type Cu+ transporter
MALHAVKNEPAAAEKSSSHSESLVLPVLGMTCSACQRHVEEALRATPGVTAARVDLMRHRAAVDFDANVIQPAVLVDAIRASGYDAVLPRAAGVGMSERPVESKNIYTGWKALVTIAAGIAVMLLSMGLMGFGGMPAMHSGLLGWTLLIVTAALAAWVGNSIYRSAWAALLHRETNMNTLVSLGTGVALLASAYQTAWPRGGLGPGPMYLDSVLLILGFLLLGKWLEERARHAALAAVDALARLQPTTARVRRDGNPEDGLHQTPVEVVVSLDEVEAGDLVVILPGERIPVDGIIESGRTTVDESMLTGESTPLERNTGGRVLAGSINYDGAIAARVESAGEGTTLRQIARLVEQAQSSRAPLERLADRTSAIFVPVVLGLALLTLMGWLAIGHDVARAISATVAVLVIACPCAMGLAVPAALTVAIGRGSQFGVLIKGGEALERIAALQAVALDKTGTITWGKPALAGIMVLDSLPGLSENDLLRMAASAEDHSAHPLAHAIVAAARERGLSWATAEDVQVIPGRGLSARVEGRACLLGNEALLREWSVAVPAGLDAAPVGATRLWMALDSGTDGAQASGFPAYTVAGYFDARDAIRPSARRTVDWLQAHGMTVEMLTGDTASAAEPIASAVGIGRVAAGLLPSDKVERIRAMQKSGLRVAMVGDGINDAAALAQADAGMAMGAGAALAQEAGDVLLLSDNPIGISTAIGLARATVRVMRQNLAWAAGYNVIGIPLAAGLFYPAFHVVLAPWMAAAAMAFSSVSVLANSLRLRGWRPPLQS